MSEPADSSLFVRLNHKLYQVAVLLAGAFFLVCCFRPLMDNVDMGWHVAQGRWMVQQGEIYQQDAFNYPNWHHPLINEYPLFQLVLYPCWRLGWWGLFLLTAGTYSLLVFSLARAARRWLPEGSAVFAIALGLMLLYFQLAFPLRPHLVTYLCVGLLGTFLLKHRAAATLLEFWPIVVLQIAWTNCHSAFVLGPIMVGLFGLEMTVRKTLEGRRPAWPVAARWALVFLLVLLACLVNPFGYARFYPPLYQGELESIRAYVGEMQPLVGLTSSLLTLMTVLAAACVGLAAFQRGGGLSYSFLFLAIVFYVESLTVLKSWPVFGLFPPLLVLSSGAFGVLRRTNSPSGWLELAGNLFISVAMLFGIFLRLAVDSSIGLPVIWREYELGRRELPYLPVAWMKSHHVEGRMLHRCEDGGLLQEQGYDRGETFSDTGFGKYDERLIHLVSMIGERPALLPLYRAAFQPDFVLCNSLCFRWPFYLRQSGWRMIFCSASGSVWTRPEIRRDLATISAADIETSFRDDLARHGQPADPLLYGRNLLALNSAGCEDFAFAQLTGLPDSIHHGAWYWEAARILCFEEPALSAQHRAQLVGEAENLHDDPLTGEFRAFAKSSAGDAATAEKILEAVPDDKLGSHGGDLLLQLQVARHDPASLARAERTANVDLRDGHHWALVAQAEEMAGHSALAAAAWKHAVFFYPDQAEILQGAKGFAETHHDGALLLQVVHALDIY